MHPFRWLLIFGVLAANSAWAANPADEGMLPLDFRKLLPLHTKLGEPEPGDWLTEHSEPGQTFRQYVHGQPIRADHQRRIIYVQPLGEFNTTQKKIVVETARFMGAYFQLPVKIREGISLDVVPKTARRKPGAQRAEQILTTYVLADVLKPRLPKDAVAMVAFTTADLWPGEGWNYVFGQAPLGDRVGVWSFHRYGDPDGGAKALHLCLVRTLRTATHETGHMFSMAHCTAFACNMCGCNNQDECDRRTMELCPQCLAKLCYATGANPAKRFEDLIPLYKGYDLKAEQELCEKSLAILRKK